VATLVNGMTRAGLVVRAGGVDDRRTATLELTGAGQMVVSEWQRVNARILAVALGALPAASRRRLNSSVPALRELTSAIDAIADAATPVPAAGNNTGTAAATG
jgi:DNA-binding MarR family transcriptional regulator